LEQHFTTFKMFQEFSKTIIILLLENAGSQNKQEIHDAQDATARMATTRRVLLRRAIGSCVQSGAAKLALGVSSDRPEMARIDRM
jgi:hypothetical protein